MKAEGLEDWEMECGSGGFARIEINKEKSAKIRLIRVLFLFCKFN